MTTADRRAYPRTPVSVPVPADADSVNVAAILRDLVRTTRHELRTSINQIIGYSELLQEQAIERDVQAVLNDLEQIRVAGRGLLAWVTAAVDFDNVAAGKLDAGTVTAEMHTPVTSILDRCADLKSKTTQAGWIEATRDAGRIDAAGRQLLQLIDRVIALSEFHVEATELAIPAERALALKAMSRARAALQASGREPARILIVDGNEAHRDLLGRRLMGLGYNVTAATDGFQGLDLLRTAGYDLVLLDVILAEMNGSDVLGELKRDNDLREIPVIMMSALDQIEWVAQCIELGAEDYLTKPFEPMILQARIEASLEKRRLRAKEVEYLREVAKVTEAATALETSRFEPDSLENVAARDDGLGLLARVFQRMGREVQTREVLLREQVNQLRIEIDGVKRQRDVEAITSTDYFQDLRRQADALRHVHQA